MLGSALFRVAGIGPGLRLSEPERTEPLAAGQLRHPLLLLLRTADDALGWSVTKAQPPGEKEARAFRVVIDRIPTIEVGPPSRSLRYAFPYIVDPGSYPVLQTARGYAVAV